MSISLQNKKEFIILFRKTIYHNPDSTSMWKSFIMRIFIEKQIKSDHKNNYVIVVPTKVIINEIKKVSYQ